MYDEVDKHESYGLIEVNAISGGERVLFGSSVKCSNTICIKIYTAEKARGLNNDWYHHDKHLIEVELSPAQFTSMLTKMNHSPGAPCTLRYVNGKRMESPPYRDERQKVQDEFKEKLEKLAERVMVGSDRVEELLTKKNLNKADRKAISAFLYSMRQEVSSNIPYVQRQFDEAVDKSVVEAKRNFDSFVHGIITSTGIEALKRGFKPAMLDSSEDKDG